MNALDAGGWIDDAVVRVERDTMCYEQRDRVATIVLQRPHVLNCIDEQWLADFRATLAAIRETPRVRVVIVRGAGRAFCSGIDLTALADNRIGQRFFREWEEALREIETMSVLVIAAIHSYCIGGGLQLALACDLRIGRDDARLGVTAVKEGIVPGLGVWRLARHAGLGRAKQLALAAEVIDATTAHQWGLLDYLADADSFESRIEALRDRLLATAWTSTRLTKQLANAAFDLTFADALELFCECQREATDSLEHREAMRERRAHRRDAQRRSERDHLEPS